MCFDFLSTIDQLTHWYEHIILVVEHNGGREISLHGILNLLLEGALLALVAVRPPG